MTFLEVLKRIQEGEGANVEFKRVAGRDLAPIGRALCAFANTAGGLIILGVDDNQEIVGVRDDAENLQERLTSFLQTACNAPVTARLSYNEIPEGWLDTLDRSSTPTRVRAIALPGPSLGTKSS